MDKRSLIPGVILAVAVMTIFAAAALSGDWFGDGDGGNYNETPMQPQEFAPENGTLSPTSINYVLFEEYGPVLLVLALLMFGSIIGGVYIAKEDDSEEEEEDTQ